MQISSRLNDSWKQDEGCYAVRIKTSIFGSPFEDIFYSTKQTHTVHWHT